MGQSGLPAFLNHGESTSYEKRISILFYLLTFIQRNGILVIMKRAFIVQVYGAWGRGPTLPEAAMNCHRAGASTNDPTVIDLVIGDDTPAIINNGMNIEHLQGAEVIRVGKGIRLHQLMRVQV